VQFLAVGKTGDFRNGRMRAFDVGGEEIAVACVDGRYYAFSNFCTHQREYLTDGFIIDGQIICGLHEATYDIETGAVLYGPAYDPLPMYPVRVNDGEVQVGWADTTTVTAVDHSNDDPLSRPR
jgi:nitrite reductase/ring-hydroxylating ferredoxin subunit